MGLFGRDDTTTKNGPVPATSPSRPVGPTQTHPSPNDNLTVIARAARFDGVLDGGGDIRVDGEFVGTINGSALLIIADNGRVKATVHAKTVSVSGKVRGDVSADERIELTPSAVVEGNLTAPRILIQEGATFEGQVNMKDPRKQGSAGEKDQPHHPNANTEKSKHDGTKPGPQNGKKG
jgi:cytoskeletal protein CcmA (bactofilin family)